MPIDRRPTLSAALADVRQHGAGVLVVAKRDRIARDVVLAAGVERAASKAGARVISADGTGNGDTPGRIDSCELSSTAQPSTSAT
jgi:DNA invertase Pin-like site-specific DNA recombinase